MLRSSLSTTAGYPRHLDSGILFATGSATLSSTSQATLRKFAANLSEHSDTDLMIIGHTDNTGTDRVNNPPLLQPCCKRPLFPRWSGCLFFAYEGRG